MCLLRLCDGFVWNFFLVMLFLVNLIFVIFGVKNDLINESLEIFVYKYFFVKKLIYFIVVKFVRCRNYSLVENMVC